MNPLNQIIRQTASYVLPRSRYILSMPPLKKLSGPPIVALTFDDGPHPEYTPRVLEFLAAHDLTATFFLIGSKVAEHPQVVRDIVTAGHSIGNHTWSHSAPGKTSTQAFADEVTRTNTLLEELAQNRLRLMRPPLGKLSMGKIWWLITRGYTTVLWNNDPKDWSFTAVDEARASGKTTHLKPGDVLLLHDAHPFCCDYLEALWESTGGFGSHCLQTSAGFGSCSADKKNKNARANIPVPLHRENA